MIAVLFLFFRSGIPLLIFWQRRTDMKTGTIIAIIVCVLVACCLFTHRRVIRALIKHEPMPKRQNGISG